MIYLGNRAASIFSEKAKKCVMKMLASIKGALPTLKAYKNKYPFSHGYVCAIPEFRSKLFIDPIKNKIEALAILSNQKNSYL